jgi:hypothetical protein
VDLLAGLLARFKVRLDIISVLVSGIEQKGNFLEDKMGLLRNCYEAKLSLGSTR